MNQMLKKGKEPMVLQKKQEPGRQRLHSGNSNMTGIPAEMKAQYEALSGFSFDDVRVHYNSDRPAQLQALAYTQGNQVYVGAGQEKHLPHELGHVVQQKLGVVKPNIQMEGVPINDEEALEHQADEMGNLQGGLEHGDRTVSSVNHVVQRKKTDFSIFLDEKGGAKRDEKVPKVLVYGIEESRIRQRILGLRMESPVKIKYDYIRTMEEELTKDQILGYLDSLPADRGGENGKQAVARVGGIDKMIDREYETLGKPAAPQQGQEAAAHAAEPLEMVEALAIPQPETRESQIPQGGMPEAPQALEDEIPYLPEGFAKKTIRPAGTATSGLYTIDLYNNYSWRGFKVPNNKLEPKEKDEYFSIYNPYYNETDPKKIETDLKEWADKEEWTKEGAGVPAEQKANIMDYQEKLLKSNYSPLETYKESYDFVATKETKDVKNSSGDTDIKHTEAKRKFELQTRRACKFGLEYAKEKECDIAFLRDEANEQAVIDKTKIAAIGRVPITTSELRKQFRIESRENVPSGSGAVFFDREGAKTSEPWKRDPSQNPSEKFHEKWNAIEENNRKFYKALYDWLGGSVVPEGGIKALKDEVIDKCKERYPGKVMSNSELIWVACKGFCDHVGIAHTDETPTSKMKEDIVKKVNEKATLQRE